MSEKIFIHAEYSDTGKEYTPYEYGSSVEELVGSYEYGDVKDGRYQIWEHPSGRIFQVKPDREVGDSEFYSTSHSDRGIVWLPLLEEIAVDKEKVEHGFLLLERQSQSRRRIKK